MFLATILHYLWHLLYVWFAYRSVRLAWEILKAIYVYFVAPALRFGVNFADYEDTWAGRQILIPKHLLFLSMLC
ncbi:unnamed protein product [Soboliphyme baturini]|uniref:TLC domain-containing protein n=1 Tax=Soboliphyme baturini TaxID=241478 RepID=A0A183J3E9_9BILA|nr:unnamed protein product [Soboliphyme baturini]